jgi:beta-glucosidase
LSAKSLNAALRKKTENEKTVLSVSANVTNTGKISAEENVQLYVRLQGTSVAEPVRKLAAFQKIALAPGETKKVTFALGPEAFSLWDIRNELNVEPCRVHIWVSPDSARGESAELEITE